MLNESLLSLFSPHLMKQNNAFEYKGNSLVAKCTILKPYFLGKGNMPLSGRLDKRSICTFYQLIFWSFDCYRDEKIYIYISVYELKR